MTKWNYWAIYFYGQFKTKWIKTYKNNIVDNKPYDLYMPEINTAEFNREIIIAEFYYFFK